MILIVKQARFSYFMPPNPPALPGLSTPPAMRYGYGDPAALMHPAPTRPIAALVAPEHQVRSTSTSSM